MYAPLAFAALALEALLGYPQRLVGAIGHPVIWIGALIARCEAAWNGPDLSLASRRSFGVATVVVIVAVALGVALAITALVSAILPWWLATLVLALAASTLIAQESLASHVRAVADALDGKGLEAGRAAVSQIVGRDPASLDEAGICRAAIESLAENFSDGVVAPVVWLVVGGLPAAAAYKAVNTADSMIGHRDARYAAFGWAAARLDDVLNLPASRLAALWIAAAAALLPETSSRNAWAAVVADARRHRSPNAGWPEAAMAGALGLKLAGPRSYHGVAVEDAWMGSGRAEATASDVRAALDVYRFACLIEAAVVGVLALMVLWLG